MTKRIIYCMALMAASLFSACEKAEEEPIGKWDPIKTTVNGEVCETGVYKVPADGGEYKIYSENYGIVWLNWVAENNNMIWPTEDEPSDFAEIHLAGSDWYEVRYYKNGNLVVTIKKKSDDSTSRNLELGLQCGNAFSTLEFAQ